MRDTMHASVTYYLFHSFLKVDFCAGRILGDLLNYTCTFHIGNEGTALF